MEDTGIVGYEGVCPVCGSSDGIIIEGQDGKYRNICRFFNCRCFYTPAPAVGFDTAEDCKNPYESDYLKAGTVTVGEYLRGRAAP